MKVSRLRTRMRQLVWKRGVPANDTYIPYPYLLSAGNNLASVVRNFTGIGRELFTDTGRYNSNDWPAFLAGPLLALSNNFFPPGQYVVSFRPDPGAPSALAQANLPTIYRPLTLEERAVRISH